MLFRRLKNRFSQKQKEELLKNPNVLKITDDHLVFSPEFKLKAIKLYAKGLSSDHILLASDFELDWFEPEYFQKLIYKWKDLYEKHGENAFKEERRGRQATGRPPVPNLDDYSIDDLRAITLIQNEIIEELKKKKTLAKK